MSAKDNVAVVKSAYEAFGKGDLPGLLDTLADDVDWEFIGPSDVPFAGNRRGKEAVGRFFGALAGTADVREFAIDRMIAEDDTVVALGHERFAVKATGREWNAAWAHVYTLSGGKITRFREHTDSAAVAAAYLSPG